MKNLSHPQTVFLIVLYLHFANKVPFISRIISIFSLISLDQFGSSSTIPRNQKFKSSSKERSLSSILSSKSSRGSNHSKKTIDAKSISKSNTSIDYEFRVQTGNESQLDGTNESISLELTNTKSHSIKISLANSINNPKPFQKGQLDLFHLNIPKHFYPVKTQIATISLFLCIS